MSYTLLVAGEAAKVLAELPFEVPEGVWDLWERLAADPGEPIVGTERSTEVHEYRHTSDARTIRVFFAVVVDDRSKQVLVPLLEDVG